MAFAPLWWNLRSLAFRGFGHLPRRLRRLAVRSVVPRFTVGTLCVVRSAEGELLLVRHSYRPGWGLPGGLLNRHEHPDQAARREVAEEVGLAVDLEPPPTVVVEPGPRRAHVVFLARLGAGATKEDAAPCSQVVVEARWFPPEDVPGLTKESALALEALARPPAR